MIGDWCQMESVRCPGAVDDLVSVNFSLGRESEKLGEEGFHFGAGVLVAFFRGGGDAV